MLFGFVSAGVFLVQTVLSFGSIPGRSGRAPLHVRKFGELPRVYDDVFEKCTVEEIQEILSTFDNEHGLVEDTRVIDRFDVNPTNELSSIETALVSFIDELGENEEPSRFIEWWWRDEW